MYILIFSAIKFNNSFISTGCCACLHYDPLWVGERNRNCSWPSVEYEYSPNSSVPKLILHYLILGYICSSRWMDFVTAYFAMAPTNQIHQCTIRISTWCSCILSQAINCDWSSSLFRLGQTIETFERHTQIYQINQSSRMIRHIGRKIFILFAFCT